MSDVRILPHAPRGKLAAPPSKSAAHRALICAALSAMPCRVFPVAASSDMRATLRVLRAMGVNWTQEENTVVFEGASWQAREPFDCLESGSTLRFLLPVAAALGLPAAFTGGGRLPERPLGALMEQMRAHGVAFSDGRLPFSISGRLAAGRYTLPGDVSSQFISGLLFALPLVEGDSEIVLTSPLQSAGYVDMTLEALAQSGIRVSRTESGWQVPGGQAYRSGERTVEADWSNAAFWLCAGAAGGDVRLTGLRDGSAQGDRAVFDLIGQFGAQISRDANVPVVRMRRCTASASTPARFPTSYRSWLSQPRSRRAIQRFTMPGGCASRKATVSRRLRRCCGISAALSTNIRTG